MPSRKPLKRKPVAPVKSAQRAAPRVGSRPPPPKRSAGRPRYEPTDKDRGTVVLMIGAGIAQPIIAQCIGITEKTLRRHYRSELDISYAKILAEIAGMLITKARNRDLAAQIFYLQTHGWVKSERLIPVDAAGNEDLARLSDAELESRRTHLYRIAAVARATRRAARGVTGPQLPRSIAA